GAPSILIAMVLGNYLLIGLAGDTVREHQREWWSSYNARLILIAALWCGAFFVSIYGPWLIGKLVAWDWSRTLAPLLGGSWLATTVSGLWAAKGPDTRNSKRSGFKEWLARIAPCVFLVGLLALTATLGHMLISLAWTANQGDFDPLLAARTLPELLHDLEVAK